MRICNKHANEDKIVPGVPAIGITMPHSVGGIDFEITVQMKGMEDTEYCKLCYLEALVKLDIDVKIKETLENTRKELEDKNEETE